MEADAAQESFHILVECGASHNKLLKVSAEGFQQGFTDFCQHLVA